MANLNHVIDKTMDETKDEDWLGYWPVINREGIIQEILDGDSLPSDAVMVNWLDGEPVETDGGYGFDAVLE